MVQRLTVFFLGVLMSPMAVAASAVEYNIHFNRTLTVSTTEVCFAEGVPRFLIAADRDAIPLLTEVSSRGGRTERRANRLYLYPEAGSHEPFCLTLKQRFAAQDANYNWRAQRNGAMWFGRDLVLPIGQWLWRPARLSANRTLELQFELPAGVNISAPWPRIGEHRFLIDHQMPYNWTGRLAIGRFDLQSVKLGDSILDVAMLNGLQRRDNLLDWLQQAAGAVAGMSGYFPMQRTQVLVLPVGPSDEAVPWAEIQRQGRPAVHFFVDQHRPIYEFTSDWTAVHEFSHLLHPYILRNDAWLYEGIASYYQNIARARNGMLTRQQAWQKLYEGFQRGSKKAGQQVLRDSWQIMQIYWGGAAFALMVDVELRKHSQGKDSLAQVLHRFRQQNGNYLGPWSAKAMLAELDTLSHSTIFSTLYQQQVVNRSFPAVYGVLVELGVDARNGYVRLNNRAPLAAMRQEITR